MLIRAILVLVVLSLAAWPASPVLQCASNAASLLPAGLPASGLAQGALVTLKGTGLGSASQDFSGYPLPTSLNDTSVNIQAGGQSYAAFVYSIKLAETDGAQDQVVILLPSAVPVGDAALTVTTPDGVSDPLAVKVVAYALGLFTQDGSGSGAAKALRADTLDRATLVAPFTPNQAVVLSATGLGPVAYDESQAAPDDAANLAPDLEIWVGLQKIAATNAARGAGASLDQISFTIPEKIDGCFVPVFARLGTVVSNVVTIPVSVDGGPCSDAWMGLTAQQLQDLSARDNIATGLVELTRLTVKVTAAGMTLDSTTDLGAASFERIPTANYLDSGDGSTRSFVGGCTVYSFTGKTAKATPATLPAILDAGPAINVSGPRGARDLTRDTLMGFYSGALATGVISGLPSFPFIPGLPSIPGLPTSATAYLEPGPYTVVGPGGVDIGAFSAGFTIPSPFQWTNQSAASSVTRTGDLTINWTGADPNGYVTISGYSIGDVKATFGAGFNCTEKGPAGTFTVPAAILQTLPATASIADTPLGQLVVAAAGAHVPFTANGCDLCAAGFSAGIAQSTVYK